jgi:glycosyltransferase involved in cell wall biosynthesis
MTAQPKRHDFAPVEQEDSTARSTIVANRKLRICIVAHMAHGAMTGGANGHVGGVERQTTIMARWLAARGHEVSILTWDEGTPDGTRVDGVRLLTICKPDAGIPVVRFFHPRTTGLWQAMRRADADVYYQNCAEYFTGLIANWCRRHGRKFVFSSAHDNNCETGLPSLKKAYERVLYRYGIRRVSRFIVQTEHQRKILREGFGLESVALPMACPGPSAAEYAPPAFPTEKRVLWAGRIVPQKRPEWLLEVAERLPEVTFDVAAATAVDSPYVAPIYRKALELKNINWLGVVPRESMPELYQRAACLVCTSNFEGFPNIFLESWSYGKPLITSFDPDGLVARLNLGAAVDSVDGFVAAIRGMLTDSSRWQLSSRNCRAHYEANYTVDASNLKFEHQFLSVCGLT